jgi:hypothetical protein
MPLTQFVVVEIAALVLVFPVAAAVCWAIGLVRAGKGRRHDLPPKPDAPAVWRPDPARVHRIQRQLDRQATGG